MLITPLFVGMTFGVLAREAGLDPLQTEGMALFVFAGAAQFASLARVRMAV